MKQAQANLDRALALHQQGRLSEARAIYEEILKAQPLFADALHLLGVVSMQSGDHRRAAELIARAIAVFPDNPAYYSNRGIALKELNLLDAAVVSYDRAIAIQPGYAESHYNRGIALKEAQQLEAAIAGYDQAIAIRSDYAEAYTARGLALMELKQPIAALASYDRGIFVKPDYAEAHSNRGNALKTLKRADAAVASYDRATAIRADFAEAYSNRGVALQELKQLDAAVASFNRAIAIRVNYAEAYYNRSNVLKELGQFAAAVAGYDRAIAIRPDYAEAYSNRGLAQQELKQLDAALASYDQAIAIKSGYAEAHANRGVALERRGRLDAALASYDRAIANRSDYAEAYWNKSLALLLSGKFDQGWELYEWRWEGSDISTQKRLFSQPLWLGSEPVRGKTVLLHAEQGYGDTIQFSRYAKSVAALGARVVMEVPKPFMRLLSGLDGVSELVERGSALPAFELHCPLLSLPLAFKTNLSSIPSCNAYLSADPAQTAIWSERLGVRTKPLVGLVWSGRDTHKNDANRSIALSSLVPFLPQAFEYVSLQKELRDDDRATLAVHTSIRHFGDQLDDFSDTAALCSLMDLVISVDTSVAHLSGALGKCTWILLPYIPDWRWLLDREDSPWYASVRLYRQAADCSWAAALERVRNDLTALRG